MIIFLTEPWKYLKDPKKGYDMSRKVYVIVKTRIIMQMDEGIEIDEVINEMDYDYFSNTEGVDFVDTEIRDFEVKDSK